MTFQDFLGRPRTLVSLVRFYSTNLKNRDASKQFQEFQASRFLVLPRQPFQEILQPNAQLCSPLVFLIERRPGADGGAAHRAPRGGIFAPGFSSVACSSIALLLSEHRGSARPSSSPPPSSMEGFY